MSWTGLALNAAGWALVVWGISRKATSRAKVRSVARSLKAVAVRARSRLRRQRHRSARAWKNFRNSVWNAGQHVRERLFKKPKIIRGGAEISATSTMTTDGTVTRGEPTVQGNECRIERIEEYLKSAEEESLFADGIVIIGGFLAVMGTVVLAFAQTAS